MTFGKDMKIGEGQKYDLTGISKDGLSEEELAKLEKKNRKLIDIYNTDGKKDLSGIELSLAMDDFQIADMDKDGKLSKKELKALASMINEEKGLEGDDAVSFRDLKRFLKDVTKITKNHEKAPIQEVWIDSNIKLMAEQYGWKTVEGHPDTYIDKDGRTFTRDEKSMIVRSKYDAENNKYVKMTKQDVYIQDANIYADKHGYEQLTDSPLFTKQGEHPDKKYLFNVETQEMVRGRQNEDGTFEGLSTDEIKTQDEQIAAKQAAQAQKDAEEQRQKDLATPKDYTVQNGETLTGLLKKSLKAQGIENPTKEQIAEAKAEFIKNNPKGVHGPKGQEILWAGDVVKIAGNLEDKNNAEQVKNDYRAFVSRQKAAEKAREAAEEEKRLKGEPPYAPVPKTPDIPSWDMDWQNKPYPGLDLFNPLEDPNKDVKVPLAPSRPATPAKSTQDKGGVVAQEGKEDKPNPEKIANMNRYPLMEELPNGYTRRDAPGYNDAYFDKNGNRITKKEYQKARGPRSREIDNMVSSPIIEQLPNGYTKRDIPGFNDAYYTKEGRRITKAEYEAAKNAGTTDQSKQASSVQKPVNLQAATNAGMKFDANGNSTSHEGYKLLPDGSVVKSLDVTKSNENIPERYRDNPNVPKVKAEVRYEFYQNGLVKAIRLKEINRGGHVMETVIKYDDKPADAKGSRRYRSAIGSYMHLENYDINVYNPDALP